MVEYPPVIRLAEIELKNTSEQDIETDSQNLANYLSDIIEEQKLPVMLLGPALPPVAMIKKTHARKIYLKCHNINILQKLYKLIDYKKYTSSIFFTPNPISH
jgi:primosomal protein N'